LDSVYTAAERRAYGARLTIRGAASTVAADGSGMTRHAPGPALWVESGGTGSPSLLMLHGLGANASVWERFRPIVAARWPGRWLAPDLRGHGRSGHGVPYGFGTHAADVAGLFAQGEDVVVLGHSMGGAVAMTLASGWFGVAVRAVIAFGVKLAWTPEQIARARELARAPVRWFATRAEAVERYLLVSGLKGLIDPGSQAAAVGVVEEGGRFRLAADPRVNGIVGVPIERVVGAMMAPLHLAAGERDAMVSQEEMRQFDPAARLLPGLGHNAHIESPEVVWQLVEDVLVRKVRP
jgi:pimeloyl-ACP methyl ester carboxylesterase